MLAPAFGFGLPVPLPTDQKPAGSPENGDAQPTSGEAPPIPAPSTGDSPSAPAGTALPGPVAPLPVPTPDLPGGAKAAQSSQASGPPEGKKAKTGLAWGQNGEGQLGNGGTDDSSFAVPTALPPGVTSVAAGGQHGLAITSAGKVVSWGSNDSGQLGEGSVTVGDERGKGRTTPVEVDFPLEVKEVTAVAAGHAHSLALTGDGKVLAWGSNDRGQLGDGTVARRTAPVLVKLPPGVVARSVSAGAAHSLITASDGRVFAWGSNTYGQLGDGTNPTGGLPGDLTGDSMVPVQVLLPPSLTVTGVSAGEKHSLAVTSAGEVFAWGDDYEGQLGNPTLTPGPTGPPVFGSAVPIPVCSPQSIAGVCSGLLGGIKAVSAGAFFSLALDSSGKILSWGAGEKIPVYVPLPEGVEKVSKLAAGSEHAVAIAEDGRLLSWGGGDEPNDGRMGRAGNLSIPGFVCAAQGTNGCDRVVSGVVSAAANKDSVYAGLVQGFGLAAVSAISPPGPPTQIAAKVNRATVTLSWAKPIVDGGDPVAGYKVYRTQETSPPQTLATLGDLLTYVDNSAEGGAVYKYQVTAINSVGESRMPTPLIVEVKASAPSRPLSLTARAGTEGKSPLVTLAWNPPEDDGGADVTGYKVYRGPTSDRDGKVLLTTTEGPPGYSDRSAAFDTEFYYWVAAVNSAGEGPVSNMASVTVKPLFAPGPPLDLTAIPQPDSTVSLEWKKPQDDGGVGPLHYGIYRGRAPAGQTLSVFHNRTDEIGYKDLYVAAGVTFCYRVSAINAVGESSQSDERCADVTTPNLVAWGANDQGQLGNGTTEDTGGGGRPTAVNLPPGVSAVSVSAGKDHTLAIGSDNAVYAWGGNSDGALGDGTTEDRLEPVKVCAPGQSEPCTQFLSGIKKVEAGNGFSLALSVDGNLFAWGRNNKGQLGDGSDTSRSVPGQVGFGLALSAGPMVPINTSISDASAGGAHSLAVTTGGQVYAWGANDMNQLGPLVPTVPSVTTQELEPAFGAALQPVSGSEVCSIVAPAARVRCDAPPRLTTNAEGAETTGLRPPGAACGLTGPRMCEGEFMTSSFAALPPARALRPTLVPVPAIPGQKVSSVAAGGRHSLALTSDGKVFAWGANDHGQNGSILNPVSHALLVIDSFAYVDGVTNLEPESSLRSSPMPTPVWLPQGYSWFAAAEGAALNPVFKSVEGARAAGGALVRRDVPVAVGVAADPVLQAPKDVQMIKPLPAQSIAAGTNHSLAISAGDVSAGAPPKELRLWGKFRWREEVRPGGWGGDFRTPARVSGDADAISAGGQHSLFISAFEKDAGRIRAFGSPDRGRLGDAGRMLHWSKCCFLWETVPFRLTWTDIPCGTVATQLDAGQDHSAAVLRTSSPQLLEAPTFNDALMKGFAYGKVTLAWAPVQGHGCPAKGYKVYRAHSEEGGDAVGDVEIGTVDSPPYISNGHCTEFKAGPNVCNWTDPNPMNEAKRCYKVSAVNAAGEGPRSLYCLRNPGPTKVRVSEGNGGVGLYWTPALGGPPITNYKIYRSTGFDRDPALVATVGKVLKYADNGLTNGRTYWYSVHAVNAVGEGPSLSIEPARPHVVSPIVGWGSNYDGQLGGGEQTGFAYPPVEAALPDGVKPVSLASGPSHGLAVTSAGGVLSWGANNKGQLGNGSADEIIKERAGVQLPVQKPSGPAPALIPPGIKVAAVSAGADHSLALTTEGRLLAWGSNEFGQLGIPCGLEAPEGPVSAPARHSPLVTRFFQSELPPALCRGPAPVVSPAPVPVLLPLGTTIKAISAGDRVSLALTSEGRVLAWGLNDSGQLGDGGGVTRFTPAPVKLPADAKIESVDAANDPGALEINSAHGVAVASDGRVFSWGANAHGELGNRARDLPCDGCQSYWPVEVKVPPGMLPGRAAAGGAHTLVAASSKVVAAGDNRDGQLGNDGVEESGSGVPVPVAISPEQEIASVAAGQEHSLAVTHRGKVFAWGANGHGELGDGPQNRYLALDGSFVEGYGPPEGHSSTPLLVDIPPGTVAKQVSAGGRSNLALTVPVANRPGEPVALSALQDDQGIALSWEPGPDNGSAITGYRIYRTSLSGTKTAPINATPPGILIGKTSGDRAFTDESAPSGNYWYEVSAVNELGEGSRSDGAHIRALAPMASQSQPPAFSNVGLQAGGFSVVRPTQAGGLSTQAPPPFQVGSPAASTVQVPQTTEASPYPPALLAPGAEFNLDEISRLFRERGPRISLPAYSAVALLWVGILLLGGAAWAMGASRRRRGPADSPRRARAGGQRGLGK
ncbi:MAG: fibronectin type III domain-containing protein [Actinomycetota bacterium]